MRRLLATILPAVPVVATIAALLATPGHAVAQAPEDPAEKAAKCATRLSIAMIGESAAPDVAGSPDPQSKFDALAGDAKFVERFASFINAQFNDNPGAKPAEDAAYHLAKHVLTNKKPWADMFTGGYDVVPSNAGDDTSAAVVREKADGLGYFRSRAWQVRYRGNEPAGIRIVAAYRIMQNTIGLELVATTNAPEANITVTGRQAEACAGCHFNNWYALDKVASVLGKRTGGNDDPGFPAYTGGPQNILDGKMIASDKELVQAMVSNEAFDVNACRLAFKYLYGRPDYSCEGPVLDKCIDAFKGAKTITSALAAVAKDPTFCESAP